MAAEDLITQADIELRIGGPEVLARFCDDDRDGTSDADVVAMLISDASQEAIGLLHNGFPTFALVAKLVQEDESVLRSIVDIACGMAGDRRPDMVDGGGNPIMGGRRDRGAKRLRELAQAQQRAAGEEEAGPNAILRSRVSRNISLPGEAFYFPRQSRGDNSPKGGGGF